ncbi:MAG: Spore coat associated protein JA (CotJA) [Pelotomaculum sp. PtaU1.Bin035]|nr:MAG: Spore coat associated protein JA (CotJA) [Pelotomaculum sp. PtaU1.Bin035]
MDLYQYRHPLNYSPAPNMTGLPIIPPYPGGIMPPLQLAHAYVPRQHMGQVFSPAEALAHGTIFPELVSPYPG